MKTTLWACALVAAIALPSGVKAQDAGEVEVEDAWLLHLEEEVTDRISLASYLAAPLTMLEGVIIGGIGVGATDMNGWSRLSMSIAGGLWIGGAVGYYATDDPEDALLTYGVSSTVALGLLHAASLGWRLGCGEDVSECDGRATMDEFDRAILVNAATGLVLSALVLWGTLKLSSSRVADLRVGFDTLDVTHKRARLLEHLRAREWVRARANVVATVTATAAAAGFTYAAIEADTSVGAMWTGTLAAMMGTTAVFGLIWSLVEPRDSERLRAGELPDE